MCYGTMYVHIIFNFVVRSKPTKRKILNYVVPRVATHWYVLGIQLLSEKEESELDIIKSNHTDNKDRCMEMFWHWLKVDINASWQQLLEALHSPAVGLPVVAVDLEKILIGSYC